jgi:exoribonuclease R
MQHGTTLFNRNRVLASTRVNGTIEFHGPKQILNINNTNILLDKDAYFIPGDKVYLDENNKPVLYERTPQAVIGIVKSLYKGEAYLYLLNFGVNCKYIPKVPLQGCQIKFKESTTSNKYLLKDRLVLWLHQDGNITVYSKYSSEAKDDVKCLLDMYSLIKDRPTFSEHMKYHHYTFNDTTNHDDLNTFTIDPKTSVDFDDAISVDVENNIIYVHIVDIANVDLLSYGNTRLRERCLTLYLSNEHTEHLLDEIDASDNLSLIVGKQRKVITVKIKLNNDGIVESHEIYKSTIVVKRRWNYEDVLDTINNGTSTKEINYLADLTHKRNKDVNYSISLPSIRILSDKKTGLLETITEEKSNDISHSLVATAMILANLVVSRHLSDKGVKIPNRFHDKIRGFIEPKFTKTGNESVDSFIMVKKFAKACYSVDRKGHFGLGISDYVHFTSPMRRYADVLVHRMLAGYENDNLESEVSWINQRASLVKICQDTYINWKITRYVKENMNNTYQIWITGVHQSGILWYMPSLSLNGFIHVACLKPKQYWKFENEELVGDNNQRYKIGDKLNARVDKVDDITGVIELEIIDIKDI